MTHASIIVRSLVALATALSLSSASAGAQTYQCEVRELLHLEERTGELKRPPNPYAIGARFAVNRATGLATASDRVGWGFTRKPGRVHAFGNAENAFVASFETPSAGDGVHLLLLRVEEFQAGKLKPFVMIDGGSVLSGLCE